MSFFKCNPIMAVTALALLVISCNAPKQNTGDAPLIRTHEELVQLFQDLVPQRLRRDSAICNLG